MHRPGIITPPRYPRISGGFILVSVLLIIALATLLVVVASMMAQIERRAAANSTKLDQARGNALFALDVALNQIQTEAGPDQRITARAEILDDTPATTNVTGVNQPYWTGVWKTGTNSLDVGANPQRAISLGSTSPTNSQIAANAAWLISGTNGNALTFTGATNGTTRDAVVIAGNYGAGANNVIAPLVQISTSTSTNGAYAYWVSDEGVKAKVNMSDPTLGVSAAADPSRSQLHFFASQASAGHKGVSAFGGTDVRSDPNLSKITTLQSLANLSGSPAFSGTNASRFSPDVTVVSRSVLADVRRGGLKKDLTAALEDLTAFSALRANYGNGAEMVYRSASAAGLTTPPIDTGVTPPTDGLLWQNLYFHYNAYKAAMPAPAALSGTPTPVTPTSSGNPAALPQVQSFRAYSLSLGGSTTKVGNLLPIPIAYRVDVAMSSYQDAGGWKLRLHYYPQMVLWNPYSVRLSTAAFQFQRNIAAFSGAGSYNPTSPTITSMRIVSTTGAITTTGPYFRVNQTTAGAGRLTLRTQSGASAVLEPGETRVFALDQDALLGSPQLAISFANLVSNPNMSADFSQQCDVLAGADPVTGVSTGVPFSTPDPNTLINVNLAAASLRCQNVDTFVVPRQLKWPGNDGDVRYLAGGGWDLAAAVSPWNASLQIQQLNGAPRRIIGFYVRQKGLLASSGPNTYSNSAAAVPVFMGNAATVTPIEDAFSYAWQEVYLSPLGSLYQNGQTDVQITPSGSNWETSFGNESAGVGAPGTRVVLRDVPNQPLVSLGQFMHMPAINFRSIGTFEVLGMGSMFVGGSYASPVIATTSNASAVPLGTVGGGAPNNKLFLDDSFLANEALFDRFFFSTVPPQSLAPGTIYPATWTEFNTANSGSILSDVSKPLLNSRMKPYFANGTAPQMADLRNPEKAAANLLLDGGFNVNSTSVDAWKAFLAGLSGNDLRIWDATQKAAVSESPGSGTPFSRFWSASGRTTANQLWSGLRVLSDNELTELATRIVEQVKLRGPFLSLADFLNRRLGAAGPLTRAGTLQAAIDTTIPDINASVKAFGTTVNAAAPPEANKIPNLIPANMTDSGGNTWNTTIGVPGYLMQQDLVQPLSPAMTVRSDTFLVRTYGEVRNPKSGIIEGRVWGEAVVQRTPELTDPSQDPEVNQATINTNTVNAAFGRRFKVVSFRWLNDDEI